MARPATHDDAWFPFNLRPLNGDLEGAPLMLQHAAKRRGVLL